MKRRIITWLLVFVMLANAVMPVQAVTPRAILIDITLTFEGETACCDVDVCANYIDDSIFVIAKLFDEDGNGVKTWVQSGSGFVNLYRTVGVTSGEEYTLRAYVTINDVSQPTVSTTRTCP